jgi:hypothetical protein
MVYGDDEILIFWCRVFRAQVDWTFILPSKLPAKALRNLPKKKCRSAAPRTEKSDKSAQ